MDNFEISSLDLGSLRQKIDSIDSKLVTLLNDRATVSINIGLAKRKLDATTVVDDSTVSSSTGGSESRSTDDNDDGRHFHIPAREKAVYERASSLNRGPLTNEAIHAIYREIMSASISLQKEVTIAYLGPRKIVCPLPFTCFFNLLIIIFFLVPVFLVCPLFMQPGLILIRLLT
jgi:chorismate mutase